MQLMIDILQETPASLRLAAKFLTDHAAMREAAEAGLPMPTMPSVPAPLSVPAGTPPAVVPVPPPPAPEAPSATVLPFPSPVPPAPSATAPATSTATETSGTAPAASAGAASTPLAPSPSSVVTPPQADEYDSAGMPWDARIHQKAKGKKKDLTWKLLKGIDPAVVSAVTQELAAQGRVRQPAAPTAPSAPPVFGQSPLPPAAGVPAAASFPTPPVPSPAQTQAQGYTAGSLPLPPAVPQAPAAPQGGEAQGGQVAPPPPPPVSVQPGATVPVPAAPVLGVPNAGNAGVVQDFRGLVAKITALRNSGRLSGEQVTAIVQQAGAPSLQMLASMAHLVPVVDSLVDATLATS